MAQSRNNRKKKKKKGPLGGGATRTGNFSPIQYLKTKARSLPIHECLLSAHWEASQFGILLVSRKQPSGNLIWATYLLDLSGRGLKDTSFNFNVTEKEYEEGIKKGLQEELGWQECDEAYASSLVYNFIEIGKEFGFSSHKDFLKATKYMLKPLSEVDMALVNFVESEDDIEIEDGIGIEGEDLMVDFGKVAEDMMSHIQPQTEDAEYEDVTDEKKEPENAEYEDVTDEKKETEDAEYEDVTDEKKENDLE